MSLLGSMTMAPFPETYIWVYLNGDKVTGYSLGSNQQLPSASRMTTFPKPCFRYPAKPSP